MTGPTLLTIAVAIGLSTLLVAALQNRSANGGLSFLKALESDERNDDYQTMLDQPATVRAMNWLKNKLLNRQRGQEAGKKDSQYRQDLMRELTLAGLDRTVIPEMVMVAQAIMLLPGAFVGWLIYHFGFISGPLGLIGIGIFGLAAAWYPRLRLRKMGKNRSAQIGKDLPDFLELTSMGITAGLSIDAAMETVLEDFTGPLTDEMQLFLDDEALGTTRRVALQRVRERTDVRSLSQLMVTLNQADEMGMPIATIMKNSAHEARMKRSQEAREAAAKLPVKMLIPLVFCVFPPILVIIMGPAVSTIRGSLG